MIFFNKILEKWWERGGEEVGARAQKSLKYSAKRLYQQYRFLQGIFKWDQLYICSEFHVEELKFKLIGICRLTSKIDYNFIQGKCYFSVSGFLHFDLTLQYIASSYWLLTDYLKWLTSTKMKIPGVSEKETHKTCSVSSSLYSLTCLGDTTELQ